MGGFFKLLGGIFMIAAWPLRAIRWLVFTTIAVFLFIAVIAGSMQNGPQIPNQVALVIDPVGVIVEQGTQVDPADEIFNELFGGEVPETRLQDVLDALEHAATDDRVDAVVLYLGDMIGGGPSTMHRIGAAIEEFKDSGKPVYAIGAGYSDQQYLLAAHANEIIMHPFGGVILTGYGRYRSYYQELLERIEVNINVFRVGTFKSALEPYFRDDMSPAAQEANLGYLSILWDNYTSDVESARGMAPGTINAGIESVLASSEAAGGDFAQMALNAGMVDSLMYQDEYRNHLSAIVGADDDNHTFNQVSLHQYLAAMDDDNAGSGSEIAVVTAAGIIVNGEAPAGTAGGDTIASQIREARHNNDVRAIVLRVDSPGGSAFASEVIRRELVLAREQGLPVVVSMGDLAASGGYWISTASDEIWASPTTITGSIGIFGMIPTFEGTLGLMGIHRDGVGTTPLSDGIDGLQPLNPTVASLIQGSIENGYQQFLERVGEARNMTVEEVDAIAQGRVWAGATALELGLVDNLGELDDAIKSAAALAGLTDYVVRDYQEVPKSIWEQLAESFSSQASAAFGLDDGLTATQVPNPLSGELARAWADWRMLTQLNDPNHAYVMCLECTTHSQ